VTSTMGTVKRAYDGVEYELSQPHPDLDQIPWPTLDEIKDIITGIRKSGQRFAILVNREGQIIDGRARELACRVLKIEPKYELVKAKNPAAVLRIILDLNLARRTSMEPGQRAALAYKLACKAKGMTIVEAAKNSDASETNIRRCHYVASKAPELFPLLEDGRLTPFAAYKLCKLTARDRNAVANADDPASEARSRTTGKFNLSRLSLKTGTDPYSVIRELQGFLPSDMGTTAERICITIPVELAEKVKAVVNPANN